MMWLWDTFLWMTSLIRFFFEEKKMNNTDAYDWLIDCSLEISGATVSDIAAISDNLGPQEVLHRSCWLVINQSPFSILYASTMHRGWLEWRMYWRENLRRKLPVYTWCWGERKNAVVFFPKSRATYTTINGRRGEGSPEGRGQTAVLLRHCYALPQILSH